MLLVNFLDKLVVGFNIVIQFLPNCLSQCFLLLFLLWISIISTFSRFLRLDCLDCLDFLNGFFSLLLLSLRLLDLLSLLGLLFGLLSYFNFFCDLYSLLLDRFRKVSCIIILDDLIWVHFQLVAVVQIKFGQGWVP